MQCVAVVTQRYPAVRGHLHWTVHISHVESSQKQGQDKATRSIPNTHVVNVNVLIHVHHEFPLGVNLQTSEAPTTRVTYTTMSHLKMSKTFPRVLLYLVSSTRINSPSPALSSCPWLGPPRPRMSPVPAAAAAPRGADALHRDIKTSY